ncbi:MAG: ABC transporter permease [Prevotellaceae bacterium]|jgi:putative ABC transport system permease protein|nr:ABC transporter permease [Prevotellaceae bacterium]
MNQLFNLIKQNPFFCVVSVIGTAVSVAFVMTVFMVYNIRTADIAPETHRSRMVDISYGYSFRTADRSNANTGLSYRAATAVLDSLPGAEWVAYIEQSGQRYCGASPEQGKRRALYGIDLNFWKVYDIPLVAGRLFTREEMTAAREVVVITERTARETFGSAAAAVGKTLFVNFLPHRVVGVTVDVSSLFSYAYGEVWKPYRTDEIYAGSEGLRGRFTAVVVARRGVSSAELIAQVDASLARYNATLQEYTLQLPQVRTYAEGQFFPGSFLPPAALFCFFGLILLIVPAINVSGLISSQMSRRLSELAVRKAYGASRVALMNQLLRENLLLAAVGAMAGFALSCVVLWWGKAWMLSDTPGMDNFDVSIGLFLRPSVFAAVFAVCLLFNWMSVFIPAWHATGRPIAEVINGE